MDAAPGAELQIRRFRDDDLPEVLRLLEASLGWQPDEGFEEFFDWKHRQNPAGVSPAWVGELDDRIVAFRTFLRWHFTRGGRSIAAVRAVDTATHPDARGRGAFRSLTLHALEELAAEGTELIFNTPNGQSRPGYLKMGWRLVGRLPVAARIGRPSAVLDLARSRVPAERWSDPTPIAEPAASLIDAAPAAAWAGHAPGLATERTPAHLRWRYGFPRLNYRALALDDDPELGGAIFRVRRRGTLREAAVCELVGAAGSTPRGRARALQQVGRAARADVALCLGAPSPLRGVVPVPRSGPHLVWRPLGDERAPTLADWDLQLGDVELF